MDPYAPSFGHVKTMQPAEFNFPADVIMLVDAMLLGDRVVDPDARETLQHIRASGEQSMLQLAFFNLGLQVPSPFIIRAHEAGWRYRDGWKVPK